jgi:subtilase family serine protease
VAAAAGCAKCSQTFRNGPDVSANANFTFYVCADQTTCTANNYGGTSFATPMWAGYLALTNEQYLLNGNTSTLGFINPALYAIGEGPDYTIDFHDITSGGNTDKATVGYDLSTGWGSPNGDNLLLALAGAPTAGFSISASPSALTVVAGGSASSTITSAVTGGFDSAITLTASGQPTGVTAVFNPTSITGAGTSSLTLTVGSSVAAGTYTITVTGTSGSIVETTTVTLTVTSAASFTITASPTTVGLDAGASASVKITTAVSGGFDSAISLSASGEGSGVTVTFKPKSIAAPGSGHSVMTIAVAAGTPKGKHTITVTGTGGGLTHTATVTLEVKN